MTTLMATIAHTGNTSDSLESLTMSSSTRSSAITACPRVIQETQWKEWKQTFFKQKAWRWVGQKMSAVENLQERMEIVELFGALMDASFENLKVFEDLMDQLDKKTLYYESLEENTSAQQEALSTLSMLALDKHIEIIRRRDKV